MVFGWKKDTGAMVEAMKDIVNGKDRAGDLLRVTNCAACHEKYRLRPLADGVEFPPELQKVKKLLDNGGKNWSSPTHSKVEDGRLEYLQPGRRVYIWPVEDKLYESVAVSGTGGYSVQVSFRWALQPGAAMPNEKGGHRYYY